MRKPCIADLIYQKTFPKPKQSDPASFYIHVHRHIVGEIRAEVQTFYGAIDTLEAQYPGLDYTYPPHRRRLSRYTWHRRLFRVFDELGLTNGEILSLCKWEGTRAAKERYEEEAETEVRTTTGNDVVAIPVGSGPRAVFEDLSRSDSDDQSETVAAEAEQEDSDPFKVGQQLVDSRSPDPANEIFEVLRDVMLSRLQGESLATNQALEQWLKEALERHEMDMESAMRVIQSLETGHTRTSMEDNTNEPVHSEQEQAPPQPPTFIGPPVQTSSIYDEQIMNDHSVQTNSTRLASDSGTMDLYFPRTRPEIAR
ncbi:hypothetical protein A1O3_02904 [Capronia epimyces CBS 606.96]|uniref:Uncharacterized protein n=1 Tax=Capronia epimyces CBS 606.96 TaxID=1182542 RepID=W9YAJ2_9EURO|nr:uncharacterized protein A1O3_02904 [Capronia epimyces CBS 606.96]EXJ89837.1 hypothetical protein A1O3_02904 [Capronia epimyces CBS 606.96]